MLKIFGVFVIFVIMGVFFVQGQVQSINQKSDQYYELETIFEEGTYQDLVNYRETNGFSGSKWIDNERDFIEWQDYYLDIQEFNRWRGMCFE